MAVTHQGKWIAAITHHLFASRPVGGGRLIFGGVEMCFLTSCLVIPSFGEKN